MEEIDLRLDPGERLELVYCRERRQEVIQGKEITVRKPQRKE